MKNEMTGAHHALCANSFFRHRHDRVKRFKAAKKPSNQRQTVSVNHDYVRLARHHVTEARRLDYHGTFLNAAIEIAKKARG